MPPSDWAKIISASVVPVVIISSCGLLCLAFYNRLAAIVSRLRGFQRERLHEQELLHTPVPTRVRNTPDGTACSNISNRKLRASCAAQTGSADFAVSASDNLANDRVLHHAGLVGACPKCGIHSRSAVHARFADDARRDDRRDA